MFNEALQVKPGITAIIGGGGKTSLMLQLARELSEKATVLVATSTKMLYPQGVETLLDPTLDEVRTALGANRAACVASIHEGTGKLMAPPLSWAELATAADYVLVEADGSKRLPLKAHAASEPVIPAGSNQVICVVGIDGIGQTIAETAHRSELYAAIAKTQVNDIATPARVAKVLNAEGLHTRVFINKVGSKTDWRAAEELASGLDCPVVAGSLMQGGCRCLS